MSVEDILDAIPGSDRFMARKDQMKYCVRPTRPIPRIFPSINSVGRTEAMMTSTIRLLFSSMTPFKFCMPYIRKVEYMMTVKMMTAKMPAPFSSAVPFSVTLNALTRDPRFQENVVERPLELVGCDELRHAGRVKLGGVLLQELGIDDQVAI